MQLPNRDPAPNHRLRSLGAQSVHCAACSATQKYTHTENAQLHKYTNAQQHKRFPIESWRQRIGCAPSWVGTPAMPYLGAPQPYPGALQPPLYLKPPSYAPPYITLYPCPAPPIWSPSDRGVELGAPPGDNNGSSVLKWRQITMLFNGSPETQNRQKQTMGGTLKAQSVHQRCRKVSATMG